MLEVDIYLEYSLLQNNPRQLFILQNTPLSLYFDHINQIQQSLESNNFENITM